jgi:hypothetical protein
MGARMAQARAARSPLGETSPVVDDERERAREREVEEELKCDVEMSRMGVRGGSECAPSRRRVGSWLAKRCASDRCVRAIRQ